MRLKLSKLLNSSKFGIGLIGVALLLYNNWLLAPFLNRDLFDHNGSISELSALTQPHFWIFRCLDITAGGLLIVAAIVLARKMKRRTKATKFLIGGTLLLGLANIFDASFVLQCSETLSTTCTVPVSLNYHHLQLPRHAYSSVIIAACYLLLPISGFFYAVAHKMSWFMLFSILSAAVAIEALLSVLMQYYTQHAFSPRASGLNQEAQMLILAAWFICWSWSVYTRPQPVKSLKRRLNKQTTSSKA